MSQSAIEKRYASALMRMSGNDTSAAQKLIEPLKAVEELFKVNDALRILQSPVMPKELKLDLLKYALSKSTKNDGLLNFIETVVDAQRTSMLPGIITAFEDMVNEKLGIYRCDLRTAVPMDEKDVAAVSALVKKKVKNCNQVNVNQKVEPNLLGGFVLQIGNAVLDLSIKSKLDLVARSE